MCDNTNMDPQHQKPKWATFMYSGKETRKITKLFKDTKIKNIQNVKHDTKYDKTTPTQRQMRQQHLPYEMPRRKL
jgi:hypothetical protein